MSKNNDKITHFKTDDASYDVIVNDSHNGFFSIRVKGAIKDSIKKSRVEYLAPAPPTFHTSYYGNAFSYPNIDIAYDNTPNHGAFLGRNFNIILKTPSAYYDNALSTYHPPELLLKYRKNNNFKIIKLPLGEPVLYRTHNYPLTRFKEQQNFYNGGFMMPVRTQEQILRDSAYPVYHINKPMYPRNHFGLKPPN